MEQRVAKQPTGIPGFDQISYGGLPHGRTTLLTGSSGSAKTVFGAQFLAAGIQHHNTPGVFVTFEEYPHDIRKNMLSLGWDIDRWEQQRLWSFVDAAPHPADEPVISGDYDFGALVSRIEHAIRTIGAQRVVLDSLGAIFSQFSNIAIIRRELFRIASALKHMDITAVMTAERTEEYGPLARFDVEEFVADNVIILRNTLENEKRRRTIEVLKFRGTTHQKGEFPFTIIPGEGIHVIPLSAIELRQHSTSVRVTSGSRELDQMCAGGFFRDSIILVSGATGTGKTLMVTEFLAAAATDKEERALLFAFEESREQFFRNASGWGIDFEKLERSGKLMVICDYPEVASLEDHLMQIKKTIAEFKPTRIAIDSLSALERISSNRGFREFVIGLSSFIKHRELVGLMTSTTPTLTGGTSVTESHISTLTDSIILLRYIEIYGEMRRGITVLKMRGSMHDKEIREFSIDGGGMRIGKPFRNVTGILSGDPRQVTQNEIERLRTLFDDPGSGG